MTALYNTPAAMIARIVAEHPRCIAMGPSLAFVEVEPTTPHVRIQVSTLVKWCRARDERMDEVTMGALAQEGDDITAKYGNVSLDSGSIPVVMVTIVCDGARYMVAIEAVR